MKKGSFGLAVLGWLLFNIGSHAQEVPPAPSAAQTGTTSLDAFVKQDSFNDVKLSPTGEFYAVSVPLEDRTVLVILRRSDLKQTGMFNMRGKTHVANFWWVNNDTVVIALGEKLGGIEQPVITGELASTRADGTDQRMIYGYRMDGDKVGSNIKGRSNAFATAFMVDPLDADDNAILIGVWPWNTTTSDPFTQVEKLDIRSGRRVMVVKAPVRRARFVTDSKGTVRFAFGADADNAQKAYYRDRDGAPWQLVASETVDGFTTTPLAFSADNSVAYLRVGHANGPDGIYAFDTKTLKRTLLLRDNKVDPRTLVWSRGPTEPIGAIFMDGKPRMEFFDRSHPMARLNLALQNSFNGEFAYITSMTYDGSLALVRTVGDRSPGDYYLFDVKAKKANHILSKQAAIDPDRMGERRPVEIKSRDGRTLHGFLTLPSGRDAKNLPLVVNPHGGPFTVYDTWDFDRDAQLIASRGYAVLQVNFRGSGNYGEEFQEAGHRQWGGTMQDDLTDATRWVVQQGIADPGRICIYGASYGGYAALMGVAKEPNLYRCAIGYVGVYDLPMMQSEAATNSTSLGNWSKDWVGNDSTKLAAASPNRMAARIKVPVFLAAGGEDVIAPIEHSKKMERALKAAGVPVETLYYDTEGHGFYLEAHNREYYTRLLAFLDKHIGQGAK